MRTVLACSMLALCSLLALGCEGYSKDRATQRCDAEKSAKSMGGGFTDASYQQCLDCFQSCGDECQAKGTTPVSYECVED